MSVTKPSISTSDEIPGCVQEPSAIPHDTVSPPSPPSQHPPLLPMAENIQPSLGYDIRKTLEEHFERVRVDLEMAREYALMNLGRMEHDNTSFSSDGLTGKSQSGNSLPLGLARRTLRASSMPLRSAARPQTSEYVQCEESNGVKSPAPAVRVLSPANSNISTNQTSGTISQTSRFRSTRASKTNQKRTRLSSTQGMTSTVVHSSSVDSPWSSSSRSHSVNPSRFVDKQGGNVRTIHDIESRFHQAPAARLASQPENSTTTLDSGRRSSQRPTTKSNDAIRLWKSLATTATRNQESSQPKPRGAVFADAEAMKDRVRTAIKGKEYNVRQFYKTSGVAQLIAKSPIFDQFTLLVISFNALWIGIETDAHHGIITEAPVGFQIVDHAFCTYFFFEVIVRYAAFADGRDAFSDAWFIFDFSMSMFYIFETWLLALIFNFTGVQSGRGIFKNSSVLRLFRLLRLTRMARITRLLNALPEVMILIKGVTLATRSVFFTLILLAVIMYVFAVGFVQLARGTDVGKEYFDSVLDAMKTLLLNGTFLENIPDCYYSCATQNELLGLLLLVYVLLASLTVMNMLIGVLVEVVSVVAKVEKESLVTAYVKQYLENLWDESGMDLNGDGMVGQDEFELLLEHPDAARCLSSVGVDVVGLVDFADFIFRGEDRSFLDFVELVLSLRGTNQATVKDIVDLRKYMAMELEHKLHIQECLVNELGNQFQTTVIALIQSFDETQQLQFAKHMSEGPSVALMATAPSIQ